MMLNDGWQEIYIELSTVIGADATNKLFIAFKGQTLMLPSHLYRRDYVVKQVNEAYSHGEPVNALAHKWGYSGRTIYDFLHEY